MGCCAYTTDKSDKLEITIPNINKHTKIEFVDISLNSEDDQEQKISDWRLYRYSVSKGSEDSFEIMSTILQSERKILGKGDSIIDSFCSNLSLSIVK